MYSRRQFMQYLSSTGAFLYADGALGMFKALSQLSTGSASSKGERRRTKYKIINRRGETVFEPQYDNFTLRYREGLFLIGINETSYGFYDMSGNICKVHKSSLLHPFTDGMAYYERGGENNVPSEVGFLRRTGGALHLSALYPGVELDVSHEGYSEGLLPCAMNGKWGVIDKNGSFVVEPRFHHVGPFHDGLAPAAIDVKAGFIDKSGVFAIDPVFRETCEFSDGLALALKDDETLCYVDISGNTVIDLNMGWQAFAADRQAGDFANGLVYKMAGNRQLFMDRTGRVVFETDFDQVAPAFSEGLLNVYKSGKAGYIDTTGKLVIKPSFDEAWDFTEGYAVAKHNDKFGYLNQNGDFVIEPRYKRAYWFGEGLALVATV